MGEDSWGEGGEGEGGLAPQEGADPIWGPPLEKYQAPVEACVVCRCVLRCVVKASTVLVMALHDRDGVLQAISRWCEGRRFVCGRCARAGAC